MVPPGPSAAAERTHRAPGLQGARTVFWPDDGWKTRPGYAKIAIENGDLW